MHLFKQGIAFCTKMYYPCTSFQWKWLTPWGVLQVAVRRIIRLVHRRIRTGKDIYRTGCFLFSVSVRVAERHHQCTTLAATLRGKWIGLPKILIFGKSGAHPSTPTKTQFWYMYEDSVRVAECSNPHTNCKCSLTYWFFLTDESIAFLPTYTKVWVS